MIVKDSKYGLKALQYLAKRQGGGAIPVAEIAAAESISAEALPAILARLEKGGLLERTPEGKYRLAHPAERITVGQVVRLLDGPLAPIPCASEAAYQPCPDCPDVAGCCVRRVMRLVRDAAAHILDNTSLLEMGAGRNLQELFR